MQGYQSTPQNIKLTHLHAYTLTHFKKGQALIEYIMIVVIIVAALLTMQIYIKRAISGRWREAADSVSTQYDPKNTTSSYTTNTATSRTETISVQDNTTISPGNIVKVTVSVGGFSTDTTRTGSETVGALPNTIW